MSYSCAIIFSVQTLGCMVSLFVVSPKLTTLMSVVVLGVVGLGTMLGSGLRKLSRQAQAQVGHFVLS